MQCIIVAVRNLYLAFVLLAINNEPLELGILKCLNLGRKHTYKLSLNIFMLTNTNMGAVLKFQILSKKLNFVVIFSAGYHTQKWTTK